MTREEKRNEALRLIEWTRERTGWLQGAAEQARSSAGMVTKWGTVGGTGGLTADHTPNAALRAMALVERTALLKRTMRALAKTYRRLMRVEGKSRARLTRDRRLAQMLKLYAFDIAPDRLMRYDLGRGRSLNRSYCDRLKGELAAEAVAELEEAGLFAMEEAGDDCGRKVA